MFAWDMRKLEAGKSSLYLYGVYVTKVCLGWSKRNGGYEIGVGKEAAV